MSWSWIAQTTTPFDFIWMSYPRIYKASVEYEKWISQATYDFVCNCQYEGADSDNASHTVVKGPVDSGTQIAAGDLEENECPYRVATRR